MAILRRQPEADSFLRIISQSEHCLLPSVSLLEISMVLAGSTGDARAWMELDALIARAGLQVAAQDTELTEAARRAFLRYGKGRHPAGLNLGDCASYALVKHRNLPLLFKGNDFPKADLRSAA